MARANMASFCFLISILMLSTAWAAQNFVPVSVCPRDLYSWNLESGKKNCQGDTPDYLCAAIENQVGNFGEICTKFGLTPANKCAVLNEQTHNLDSVDCKAASGCPAQAYLPSVLWQYQICFKDFYGTTTTLAPSTTQTITTAATLTTSRNDTVRDGPEDVGSGGVAIAVVFILIIVVVLVVVLAVFYRRNQFGFRDKLCHTYHTGIKLNPDYMVEKGIVITGGIITALKFLKSRNVVILKGVIGCGKTHALKAIQNHFQERNWETEWVKSENFQGKTSYEKQTILLCDNFFGTFGSNVFSQDDVNKTEQFLREIECSKQTKVVIVIHKHVDDEIKKSLKLNFLHQKNITVDMDTLSEAETLLIFKEQQQKGHYRSDSNCWFKTVGCQFVLDKLSKNPGHIGNPFLSLIYCDQHELFADDAFSVNPIQTLMEHFKKIREGSTSL